MEPKVPRHTNKDKIARSISKQKSEVILRAELKGMGSASQIGRTLKHLIEEGKIIRLGHGIYAKARPSLISGRPTARVSLEELAQDALQRLGVTVKLGRAQAAYAAGKTTQIPVHTTFNTGNRRITRKISVGKSVVRYENNFKARR